MTSIKNVGKPEEICRYNDSVRGCRTVVPSTETAKRFLFAAMLGILLELTKFPLQLVSSPRALFMDLKYLQSN